MFWRKKKPIEPQHRTNWDIPVKALTTAPVLCDACGINDGEYINLHFNNQNGAHVVFYGGCYPAFMCEDCTRSVYSTMAQPCKACGPKKPPLKQHIYNQCCKAVDDHEKEQCKCKGETQ